MNKLCSTRFILFSSSIKCALLCKRPAIDNDHITVAAHSALRSIKSHSGRVAAHSLFTIGTPTLHSISLAVYCRRT